jgi:hypothetical protein
MWMVSLNPSTGQFGFLATLDIVVSNCMEGSRHKRPAGDGLLLAPWGSPWLSVARLANRWVAIDARNALHPLVFLLDLAAALMKV